MDYKINILLVDDHKLIRDGIKVILKADKELNVVGEVSDGKEAISFLAKKKALIDVVLMDINMPKLDGISATKILTKKYPKLNILALTMHEDETYIHKMIQAGALGYILKDSTSDQLINAVKKIAKGERNFSTEVSNRLISSYIKKDKNAFSKKLTNNSLTTKEIEVLKIASDGHTNSEIAKMLCINKRTIESHKRNILQKLNTKNTTESVKYAILEGLIPME